MPERNRSWKGVGRAPDPIAEVARHPSMASPSLECRFNSRMTSPNQRRVAGRRSPREIELRLRNGNEDRQSAFAEYAALRQEIADRTSAKNTILTLQLTVCGALFSFALSGSNRTGFLLIVLIASYMLFIRFAQQYYGIENVVHYITDYLSPRVHGGFGWEAWKLKHASYVSSVQARPMRVVLAGSTSVITFPGVATAALAWSLPYSFFPHQTRSGLDETAIAVAWICGCAATATSVSIGLRLRHVSQG